MPVPKQCGQALALVATRGKSGSGFTVEVASDGELSTTRKRFCFSFSDEIILDFIEL